MAARVPALLLRSSRSRPLGPSLSYCSSLHFMSTASLQPKIATDGVRVAVRFQMYREDDGTVIDSSEGKDPLTFVCGGGRILRGLDKGVRGMEIGQEKVISLEGDDGFGRRDDSRTMEVPLDRLPPDVEIGSEVTMEGSRGSMNVVVTSLGEEKAVVDFNHPLAGLPLRMNFNVVGLEEVPKINGLVVETLSPGDGKTYPEKGDQLTMHYTGKLAATGAKFDSSHDRGNPFEFQIGVGQVISGWDEGVLKMSVGEHARLLIPSEMGYGEKGAGDTIPPNSDLVFEVELLKIN